MMAIVNPVNDRLRARWLMMCATLLVSACIHQPRTPVSDLLPEQPCADLLPVNHQWSGLLQLPQSGQQFVIALDSQPGRLQMVVLTAQGLPLYDVRCDGAAMKTGQQATVSGLPPERDLMNYLFLTYGELSPLHSLLSDRVLLSADADGQWRILKQEESELSVRYKGAPPWFDQATITSSDGPILIFKTLDQHSVLPE